MDDKPILVFWDVDVRQVDVVHKKILPQQSMSNRARCGRKSDEAMRHRGKDDPTIRAILICVSRQIPTTQTTLS